MYLTLSMRLQEFQSTPPARGATFSNGYPAFSQKISIHAPREGGDSVWVGSLMTQNNFNPRPPRGGRQDITYPAPKLVVFQSTPPARGATGRGDSPLSFHCQFQSTPPARGATFSFALSVPKSFISIHAPREGGDPCKPTHVVSSCHFNPRPPRGGRQNVVGAFSSNRDFNPRPPRGGRPNCLLPTNVQQIISIHAPREGGDRCCVSGSA